MKYFMGQDVVLYAYKHIPYEYTCMGCPICVWACIHIWGRTCLLRTVDDPPEVKYINTHVRKPISTAGPEVWLDLGIELLQNEDVAELRRIKNSISDYNLCCSEMFKLWLEREPTGSWRNLIDALKQID